MVITKAILSTKRSGLKNRIRPFTLDELDSAAEVLASGGVDRDAVKREFVFKREVATAIKNQERQIRDLQSGVSFQKASLRLLITTDYLSTTDVLNDTITCLSQTVHDFDFTDSRRFTKVVLSPGSGVKPHELRFDKVIQQGDNDYPQSVYAVSATKLQLVIWNGTDWDAISFDVGWTIDISQYIDGDLPVI